jgi:hypothetical protein
MPSAVFRQAYRRAQRGGGGAGGDGRRRRYATRQLRAHACGAAREAPHHAGVAAVDHTPTGRHTSCTAGTSAADAVQVVCCVDMDAPMAVGAAQAVAEEQPTVEVAAPASTGVDAGMEPEPMAMDGKHDPSPAQGASVVVEVRAELPAIEEAKPSPPPPSPPPAPATPLTLRALWSGAAGANRFPAGSAPALAYEVRKHSLALQPPAAPGPQEAAIPTGPHPARSITTSSPETLHPHGGQAMGMPHPANDHLKGFGSNPLRAHKRPRRLVNTSCSGRVYPVVCCHGGGVDVSPCTMLPVVEHAGGSDTLCWDPR